MEEVWKDIKDYEGVYQVSNLGRVKRISYQRENKEKELKVTARKDGYIIVCLCKNGVKTTYNLHRLVAEAFLDNPDNLPCVNHKDENPSNCVCTNLEWCTYQYNNTYGTFKERQKKTSTNGKLSKPVIQYDKEGNYIKEYPSIMEVERQLGFNHSFINGCCLGRKSYKTAYDYIWRYK